MISDAAVRHAVEAHGAGLFGSRRALPVQEGHGRGEADHCGSDCPEHDQLVDSREEHLCAQLIGMVPQWIGLTIYGTKRPGIDNLRWSLSKAPSAEKIPLCRKDVPLRPKMQSYLSSRAF